MTDYSQVPIVQCSYQMALVTQRLVGKFPKHLRFQLGDRLAGRSQDFFENTVKANFIRDPKRRTDALTDLSADLFTFRMTLRMAKDLQSLSVGEFTDLNIRIEDIQKQLTGWSKWSQSKIANHMPEDS